MPSGWRPDRPPLLQCSGSAAGLFQQVPFAEGVAGGRAKGRTPKALVGDEFLVGVGGFWGTLGPGNKKERDFRGAPNVSGFRRPCRSPWWRSSKVCRVLAGRQAEERGAEAPRGLQSPGGSHATANTTRRGLPWRQRHRGSGPDLKSRTVAMTTGTFA